MAIIWDQKVEVKWSTGHEEHYIDQGYPKLKRGSTFSVDIKDLPKNSSVKVRCICDACGELTFKSFNSANNGSNNVCNVQCYGKWKRLVYRVVKDCEICGESFESKRTSNQRFCSITCQKTWQSRFLTGENANNFKNEYTDEQRTFNCDYCNESFRIKAPIYIRKIENGEQKYKFCKKECREKWHSEVWSQSNEWKETQRKRMYMYLEDGTIGKTDTGCQRIVNEVLNELGIKYKNEHNLKYCNLDNYLLEYNLMIEVMGTFWHSDPRKYDKIKYDQQLRGVISDKRKKESVKKLYGVDILYLWEKDILDSPKLVKQLIQLYVYNDGLIKNYNSFNYHLDNGDLVLNKNIIKGYMDLDNDARNNLIEFVVGEKESKKQYDKWITFNCDNCGKEKEELISKYNKKKSHFCSVKCMGEFKTGKPRSYN